MRALARAAVATCIAALVVPLWALPAAAEASSETASSGAYFWQGTPRRPDQLPANPPPVQGNADGVEAGKLAVAAAANQEDKVSFLFFSLSAMPAGSTITKATLTLPLASGSQNVSYAATPEKVWACPAGPEGFGGEDAGALADAPKRLCSVAKSGGKATPDGKAYQFDVSTIAAGWATANDGLALTAAEGARSTPFQVVFESFDKATLAYEFTAPPPDSGTAGTITAPVPEPPAGDSGTPPTDITSTIGTGTASAPADLTAVAAPVDAPVGTAAPPPVTAPGAPAVAQARRTAAVDPNGVLRPTAQFWLAVLALGAGLVVLSMVLGQGRTPVPAHATAPTRLSRALATRSRGTALSPSLSPSP